jgi:IS1 family transposase
LTIRARVSIMSSMNRLGADARARVLLALVDGNSLRATARLTGVARMTVEKLLRDLGAAAASYHDARVRNLRCQRIQCDEIWSFVYCKAANIPKAKQSVFGYGDVWTWVGLDADTKLAVSWLVGPRDASAAYAFMSDIASRLRHRVQLTTDGHVAYLGAVEDAFGGDIDYAVLQKFYGSDPVGEKRYSPAICLGAIAKTITGEPNPKHIATSYVERQNLTMRMHMRRFTRLTNGFSKKVEMHEHAVALHFLYYNFAKIHQTLRVTPAMEAGLADHVWSATEVIGLLDPVQR